MSILQKCFAKRLSADFFSFIHPEIKNILNHYKRLGKDEDRYIESFNNIAAQYNDAQLRIITKFLPLNVKAVLEEKKREREF